MTLRTLTGIGFALALVAVVQPARAADGISVELNKMVAAEGGCRIYMVFANNGTAPIDSYKPDLVFFDKEGVIRHRLIVEGGPLPAGKTKVKLFDAKNVICKDIGRMLLNDVAACDGGGHSPADCLARTETVSRADIEFVK